MVSARTFSAAAEKIAFRQHGSVTKAAALADIKRVHEEHGDINQQLLSLPGKWTMGLCSSRLDSLSEIRKLLDIPLPKRFRYLEEALGKLLAPQT